MKDYNNSYKECIRFMWRNTETSIIWNNNWKNITKQKSKNSIKRRNNYKKFKKK